MNLHNVVRSVIGAVNPNMLVSVQVSTGPVTNADGSQTPTYAPAVSVQAQVQPMEWPDLRQIDGLNLQGTKRVIYLNGEIDGLIRVSTNGGDLVTFPDGSVWLVATILEGFSLTAGWTKAVIVLQNGS